MDHDDSLTMQFPVSMTPNLSTDTKTPRMACTINLALPLCDEAKPRQIVISQRAFAAVEQWLEPHTLVS